MAPLATAVVTPYPGLRPFRENEADFFFGQDVPLTELRTKLYQDHFVAILGLSGSGKSSLLKAGLLAEIRPKRIKGGRSRWLIGCMKPGGDPLRRLVEVVSEVDSQLRAEALSSKDIPHDSADVASTLLRDASGLARYGHEAPLAEQQEILVVVDQFEELFRYQREVATHSEKDRAALFVQLLLEAARDKECRISVVITMRSEFLGDCALFFGLAEQVNQGTFLLPKMTRAQIEEVITGPANQGDFAIDPAVVQQLLNETEKQDDGLPLLQHALRRIHRHWEQRGATGPISMFDLASFQTSPPQKTLLIKHHLDDHLNSIFESFTGEQKMAARLLFRLLSELDYHGRVTRRPLPFHDIGRYIGQSRREPLKAVIEAFRDEQQGRTFLTPGWPEPFETDVIDISHECLLRRWDRLKKWIAFEQRDAEQFRRLAEDADNAELQAAESGKPRKPLEGINLEYFSKWRQESRAMNADWALRYEGEYSQQLGRPLRSFAAAEAYLSWSAHEAKARTEKTKADEEARIRAEERAQRAELETALAKERQEAARRGRYALLVLLVLVSVTAAGFSLLRERVVTAERRQLEAQAKVDQEQAKADQQQRRSAEQIAKEATANATQQQRLRDQREKEKEWLEAVVSANEAFGESYAVKTNRRGSVMSALEDLEQETEKFGRVDKVKQMYSVRKAGLRALGESLVPELVVGGLQAGPGEAACYSEDRQTVFSLLRSGGLRYNGSPAKPSEGGTDSFQGSKGVGGGLFPGLLGRSAVDLRLEDLPNSRDLSDDCRTAAIGSEKGFIDRYDTTKRRINGQVVPATPLRGNGEVDMVRLSPDGQYAVASFSGRGWVAWALNTARLIPGEEKVSPSSAVFSPNGRWMLLAEVSGNTSRFDLNASPLSSSKASIGCCKTPAGIRQQSDVANDGSRLWFEGGSSDVVYAPMTGTTVHTGKGRAALRAVRMSRDGTLIAAGREDGSVDMWEVADSPTAPTHLADQSTPSSPVAALSWSPSGRYLTVLHSSGTVRVWQVKDGPTSHKVKKILDLLRQVDREAQKEEPGDTRVLTKAIRDRLGR